MTENEQIYCKENATFRVTPLYELTSAARLCKVSSHSYLSYLSIEIDLRAALFVSACLQVGECKRRRSGRDDWLRVAKERKGKGKLRGHSPSLLPKPFCTMRSHSCCPPHSFSHIHSQALILGRVRYPTVSLQGLLVKQTALLSLPFWSMPFLRNLSLPLSHIISSYFLFPTGNTSHVPSLSYVHSTHLVQ